MSTWDGLQWTLEDQEAILKNYGRTIETATEDVEALKSWVKKQPHLAKYFTKGEWGGLMPWLILLVFNKFRIEQAKTRFEMYFSLRPFFPEIFYKMHNKDLQRITSCCYQVGLPKLTDQRARIYISRLRLKGDINQFSVDEYLAKAIKYAEVRTMNDICLTDYYIIDVAYCTMHHFSQYTPMFLKKIFIILDKIYALRVEGIYVINAPKAVDNIISVAKQLLKEKIAKKLHSSTDASLLFKLLPLSEIPSDYGGGGKSLEELSDMWMKKFEEMEDWLERLKNDPVDQKLRPGKQLDNDEFGVEGHFRKLNVD